MYIYISIYISIYLYISICMYVYILHMSWICTYARLMCSPSKLRRSLLSVLTGGGGGGGGSFVWSCVVSFFVMHVCDLFLSGNAGYI